MSEDTLLVRCTQKDGVGEVLLSRASKMNSMTEQMVAELRAAFRQVVEDGARAIVVHAEGRAFSAGRDIAGAQQGVEDGGEVLEETYNPLMREAAALPVPTFAAVQGACLGTGLGLALACDVVFVAEDAKIGSPFARIGAVLDSGAHHAFVTRIGAHRTLELIYTGRLLTGAEAAAWGLVNASFPADQLLEQTRSVASAVAAGPTLAFVESKRIVRQVVDNQLTFDEVLTAEAGAQSRASRSADYVEGFTAFLEKRRPTFSGQ
jgi:2-(1,2-epoxy-1,2-dihydrophenyl)acetyl-CoA isomerase